MIFKELLPSDIKTSRSSLSQLIDVLQNDIFSSVSRRKYQVFVTGGLGPGVTSSLYQTVYDQDFSLQTANPVFDITFGIRPYDNGGNEPDDRDYAEPLFIDSSGKEAFSSETMMMREKFDIYRQFANSLLGDPTKLFHLEKGEVNALPSGGGGVINDALFLTFRRLFARDRIRSETFAMSMFQKAAPVSSEEDDPATEIDEPYFPPDDPENGLENLFIPPVPADADIAFFTDIGASNNRIITAGGELGIIKDASDLDKNVGLIFYDRGVVVLDLNQVINTGQYISGTISAVTTTGQTTLDGYVVPDLIVSASIDQIIDHLAFTRFGSTDQTGVAFQNVTNINSSLIFCRAAADEFNYSSNPTYLDSAAGSTTPGRVVTIDQGQDDQQTFSFVTSVGLYDSNNNLLAVAKLSRPVEKSPERDLTFRVRLDF
jgi:hypothetical protein